MPSNVCPITTRSGGAGEVLDIQYLYCLVREGPSSSPIAWGEKYSLFADDRDDPKRHVSYKMGILSDIAIAE
jgi:hypothetical protein